MPKPLTISAEALFELERELAEPLFFGVPIGSTLGQILAMQLFESLGQWDLKSVNKDRLRYWYHWFRGLKGASSGLTGNPSSILLTWSNEKPYCRDLVLPLLEALGPSRCTVIGYSPAMASQLPGDTAFLIWEDFPQVDLKHWRPEYRRCSPVWHRKTKGWLRRHGLPGYMFPHLADAMLVQSQRVISSGHFLDVMRPKAVVVEFDRSTLQAPLVLVAKARGIPTMTMIHGVINPPYGYTPLLADLAFCWGERHMHQMMELGTPPERLVITGCQRLTRTLAADPVAVKAKVGLPPDKPLALLASNPIHPDHRRKLARAFCEGIGNNGRITAVVRLHPSEEIDFYIPEMKDFPRVRFLENSVWTLDEALAAADVVVCHDSGLGNDALVKGKLTVVMDVLPMPLKNGLELCEQAGCPCVRDHTELHEVLIRIISDESFYQRLKNQAEKYVERFCVAFGDQAAANIARAVKDLAKDDRELVSLCG